MFSVDKKLSVALIRLVQMRYTVAITHKANLLEDRIGRPVGIRRRDERRSHFRSINPSDSSRIPSLQHIAILLFEELANRSGRRRLVLVGGQLAVGSTS